MGGKSLLPYAACSAEGVFLLFRGKAVENPGKGKKERNRGIFRKRRRGKGKSKQRAPGGMKIWQRRGTGGRGDEKNSRSRAGVDSKVSFEERKKLFHQEIGKGVDCATEEQRLLGTTGGADERTRDL